MSRVRLSRKAKQRAINVLLWYPDNVKDYNALLSDLLSRDPEHKGGGGGKPLNPDPTADAAIKLAENEELQHLKREVRAVEYAIEGLLPAQLEVIRLRFWDIPKCRDGWRRPQSYDYIDVGYSERQMHRIVWRVMLKVATALHETKMA